MEWISLGWRDGILLLVAIAAMYLVFMLLKLTRISHHRRQEPAGLEYNGTEAQDPPLDTVSPLRRRSEAENLPLQDIPESAPQSVLEEEPPAEAFVVLPQTTSFEWDEVRTLFGDSVEEGPEPKPAETTAPRRAGGFGEHLAEHLARSDMEMEVQRMRSEMERMRGEMEELRTARRVSPQYAEAMEMAQRGLTAQDLADQLGISLGEAELVHALSRSDQNYDEGDEHGAEQIVAGFNEFKRRRPA